MVATTSPSPSPDQRPKPAGIRYTDRVFVAGINGSGKSVLINHLGHGYRCQRFLYDTKDEFTVPGVEPVHRPESIDWDQPLIHFIDDTGELDDTDRLFRVLWQRKVGRTGHRYGLVVIVHELADLCADQPGGTPAAVNKYIRKGRAHGLGLLAGSQRPRNIPRAARTEAQHVFSFAGGFDPEDLPIMAKLHRMTIPEYEAALAQAGQLGEHAYVWGDRRARTNVIRPPLPPERLRRTLASGIDPGDHRAPESTPESSGESKVSGKPPESSGDVTSASSEG